MAADTQTMALADLRLACGGFWNNLGCLASPSGVPVQAGLSGAIS